MSRCHFPIVAAVLVLTRQWRVFLIAKYLLDLSVEDRSSRTSACGPGHGRSSVVTVCVSHSGPPS